MPLFLLFLLGAFLVPGVLHSQGDAEPTDAESVARPPNSAAMMQREIDRRRELTFRLNEILDLADRLYQSGEWDHAEAKYNLVLRETDPQAQTGGSTRAQIGKARCFAAKALAKEEKGNLAEAAGLWKQAAEIDPTNKAVARKAAEAQEVASRQADPFSGNPAVSPDLLRKTAEIKSSSRWPTSSRKPGNTPKREKNWMISCESIPTTE